MTSLYRSFKNALILAAGLIAFSPIQLGPLTAIAQNLSTSYANNYTGAVEVDVYNEFVSHLTTTNHMQFPTLCQGIASPP